MPKVNCCVPNCVSSTKRTPTLSFYQLPVEDKRRKLWIQRIRNENLRTESKWTSVCSLHFTDGKKTYMNCHPTIFPWSAEWSMIIKDYNALHCVSSQLKKPLPLNIPKHSSGARALSAMKSRRRVLFREPLDKNNVDDKQPDPLPLDVCDITEPQGDSDHVEGNHSDGVCSTTSKPYYPETHLPLKDDLQNILDSILKSMDHDECLNDVGALKAVLRTVINLLKNVKEEFDVVVKLRDWDKFLFKRFEGSDDDIKFWTGFYSHDALMAFYKNLLEPKVEFINYWGSINSDGKKASHLKGGPKRKLQPIDEMFLTLVKLKQGSANLDLAERFNISDSHVSRIFTTWVKFMLCMLSEINAWMPRKKVKKFMPSCFQELYKDVRVIIDCTEIPLQRPSDFECQSATYSSYKHCNTLKGLVGISPSGVPTFVSNLFEGSISDNQITFESGLLKLCEKGDAIMADRGFTCREAVSKQGIRLVIPHFLGANDQLNLLQITESAAIARVRIHVERAMGRIKQWHILSRTLPVTYWNCANEIFQLCTKLVLFWPPLIDEDDSS